MEKNKNTKVPMDILCNDTPTKYAHLGFRLVLALISWVVLGKNISSGDAFFPSVALFISPLLLDYFKYEPTGKIRIGINWIARFVNLIFLVFAILGMCGILTVIENDRELFIQTTQEFVYPNLLLIDIKEFWLWLFLPVFICGVDWVSNKTTLETRLINELGKGEV